MGPKATRKRRLTTTNIICVMSHKSGNLIYTGEKKWNRAFFNLTSKCWDLEFISRFRQALQRAVRVRMGKTEAFGRRRWSFSSKRVRDGYVGVSSVAMILPLLHTHILFMYHRRCIILAVDCIVKWHSPVPFLPRPCACLFHASFHFELPCYVVCCCTSPYRITSRYSGRLWIFLWSRDAVIGAGHVWTCRVNVSLVST